MHRPYTRFGNPDSLLSPGSPLPSSLHAGATILCFAALPESSLFNAASLCRRLRDVSLSNAVDPDTSEELQQANPALEA